jgi:hypothetical protein
MGMSYQKPVHDPGERCQDKMEMKKETKKKRSLHDVNEQAQPDEQILRVIAFDQGQRLTRTRRRAFPIPRHSCASRTDG